MSLRVWLPLNGDLHNQGLTNITLSSGTPTYTNGKIGRCLNTGTLVFNVSDNLITTLGNNNIYTICCWCKNLNTSTSSRWVFVLSSGTGTSRGLWEGNSASYRHWAYSGSGVNMSTAINTIDGGWHHICFTSNGNNVKLYVDGIQQSEITNASTTAMTSNTFELNATDYNLNDFRIYDHCLSPMEVKQLAQGLVLHYPLNRGGWGQENLWRNSSCQDNLDGMIQSTVKFVITTKDGYKCAHLSGVKGSSNATGYLGIPDAMVPEAGAWYTISADMRIDNYSAGSTNPYVGIYFGGDYLNTDNTGGWYGGSSYSGDGMAANNVFVNTYNNKGWHRVTCTVQYLHGGSEYKKGAFCLGYIYARDFTGDLYVKNIKFEKGLIATPWCPNSSDTLATTMDLNGTTEYDCSGFCNNGTRTGTFGWTSDTPKYLVSTGITAGGGIFTPMNVTFSQYTIAFWAKHTVGSKMLMGSCPSAGSTQTSWYWYGDNSFKYPSGEYYYTYNGGAKDSFKWTHFVATYDGANVRVYRNGVSEGSKACTGDQVMEYLSVGYGYGNSYIENSNMSDFRIYATALSADDVKSLYQNSAYIDSSGNIYGAIHMEA